jgi:hypothetical protein
MIHGNGCSKNRAARKGLPQVGAPKRLSDLLKRRRQRKLRPRRPASHSRLGLSAKKPFNDIPSL